MAKKKAGKGPIPKRIGGVKIPKKVRKNANRALELADNPLVREAASAAILAGATRLLATVEAALEARSAQTSQSKDERKSANKPNGSVG